MDTQSPPVDSLVSAPPRSRKRSWIAGVVLLLVATGIVWTLSRRESPTGGSPRGGGFGRGPTGNQAVPVRVVTAQRQDIDVHLKSLGTVTPLNTVTVRSRLDGELVRVLFQEGQRVKAGALLAEIDARPYQVQLAQAEGQQQENRARLKNAEGDLATYQRLYAEQLITRQQLTTQEALVSQIHGALQSNEAQVNSARLNLAYAKVVAPISGRLGLRQVDVGNLVRSGDANGLVVIAQMQPISVLFTVPESDLPAVLAALRGSTRLPVEAWDRAETTKLADGTLQTVDNQIDTTTGTIKLRAVFENATEALFPNQFVNVRLRVTTLKGATVIPSASIQRASFGTFAYVVQPDSTVTIRRITPGPAEGDRTAVTAGLSPDDRIVIEGVDDLTEGTKVEIVPESGNTPAEPPRARPQRGPGQRGSGRRGGGPR